MAIQNIYIRTRQKGQTPEDDKQFLDAIQQRIIDYQSIVTGHDRPLPQFYILKKPTPAATQQSSSPAAHAGHEDPAAAPRGSVNKAAEAGAGGASAKPSVHGTGSCRVKGNLDTSVSGSGHGLSMTSADGQKHGASLTRAGMS